jgi:N-sulfoglucosamine sulfohydrolase
VKLQSNFPMYPIKMKYLLLLFFALPLGAADQRPNIVWIFTEDMNDWMGCYGDSTVPTPNIDQLAAEGMRFDRAYMPAGVCSATRSAIAYGAMQTSIGAHNHRSSRQRVPGEVLDLPEKYRTVYQQLRDNGYYVVNNGPKNDFNFTWAVEKGTEGAAKQMNRFKTGYGTGAYLTEDKSKLLYDVNIETWAPPEPVFENRPKGKPIFIQFQLSGGKNNGNYAGVEKLKKGSHKTHTDQSKVEVMPYYPDVPSIRREIAHHYDTIRQTDEQVGQIVNMLKREGIYENTVIFFWTDHGMKLYRHKQWLYEGGIRVPMIASGPGIEKGVAREDLVSGIDITATTLALSETPKPDWVEGENLLAKDFKRNYVISARDRCDFAIERVRAVTTRRFKYLKNFMTDRLFMQPQYRDGSDYVEDARKLYVEGTLNAAQSFSWAPERVAEELYDLNEDPFEINNLAADPDYAKVLERHRKILTRWIKKTDDKGQYPETVVALKGVLEQWGDQAVNPEYDKARD